MRRGAVTAQSRMEVKLMLRRGESVLVTLGIPLGILVFFSMIDVLPHGRDQAVDFLAPGVLALSVIAMGMVALAISTAFDRQNGVLKRLGATPLGRGGLLAAKSTSITLFVAVQAVAIAGLGVALGWRPSPHWALAVVVIVAGTVTFTGLGFVLAGNLRAETVIAVANALFLLMLLLGDVIVPADDLPGPLASLARVLPAQPFTVALRSAFEGVAATRSLFGLGTWTVGAIVLATRTFRWE